MAKYDYNRDKWILENDVEGLGSAGSTFAAGQIDHFARMEVKAANDIESVLCRTECDLPSHLWQGARLLMNAMALRTRGALFQAENYVRAGLEAYEQGLSLSLCDKVNEARAEVLANNADAFISDLTMKGGGDPTPLPYPEDDPLLPPGSHATQRLAFQLQQANDLLTSAEQFNGEAMAASKTAISKLEEIETRQLECDKAEQVREKQHKERISELERAMEERLSLGAQTELWEKRASHTQWYKLGWFAAVLLTGGLLATAFYIAAVWINRDWQILLGAITGENSHLLPLIMALVIIPVGLVFWFLRILLRNYRETRAIEDDARERTTMLQTYIYLVAEGKMLPEDRMVVLHALFRPRAVDNVDDGNATLISQFVQSLRDGQSSGGK